MCKFLNCTWVLFTISFFLIVFTSYNCSVSHCYFYVVAVKYLKLHNTGHSWGPPVRLLA